MSDLERVICTAQEIPTDDLPPQWVHLIPLGSFKGRDGRAWNLNLPHRLVERFKAKKIDLPIDFEHQTADQAILETGSGPVPAAGWIKELEVRKDGIWGRVDWTERAAELLKNREYRFLSPVFMSRKSDGEVTSLKSAGLVHTPNLYLTNLAREDQPVTTENNDTRDIALALGLDAGADTETIVQAINRQKTPDPEKFVPLSAVKDLMQSHATQTDANREADVEMTVQRAMDEGKISPGMKDWATDLCRQNPASFAEFTNSSPAAFDHLFKSPGVFDRPAPQSPTGKLTDEELAVCNQLGISPDQLVKA